MEFNQVNKNQGDVINQYQYPKGKVMTSQEILHSIRLAPTPDDKWAVVAEILAGLWAAANPEEAKQAAEQAAKQAAPEEVAPEPEKKHEKMHRR